MSFALTVLAACFALKLAAAWLLDALPVLLPTAVVLTGLFFGWRWWRNHTTGW